MAEERNSCLFTEIAKIAAARNLVFESSTQSSVQIGRHQNISTPSQSSLKKTTNSSAQLLYVALIQPLTFTAAEVASLARLGVEEAGLHRVFAPNNEGRAEAAAFCELGTAEALTGGRG